MTHLKAEHFIIEISVKIPIERKRFESNHNRTYRRY